MLTWYGKKPLDKIEYYPAQEKEVYGDRNAKEFNKLFWGDNLQVLSHLLKDYRGKVDLIYIDPPFDSKAEYVKKVKIRGRQVEGQQQSVLEEKQYSDIWENDEYLQFMYERLLIIRELLADAGSIYLHCDWHRAAYLKVMMDEVFGEANFQREIIWGFENISGFKSMANNWIRAHETILFYSKSSTITFNKLFTPYDPKYLENFDKVDGEGRTYWQWSSDTRRYLDELGEGIPVGDIWEIKYENNMAQVRTTYPTQKPEALLDQIITASSKPGDLVLDCFAGSGTTLAVAQKLGRRWIGCDINIGAIQTATKRLNQIISHQQKGDKEDKKGLRAFKVYNVNDYNSFKNEMEAKSIIIDVYNVEPMKMSFFDGQMGQDKVKVMPLNRVLNKRDVDLVIQGIEDNISDFTPKAHSKHDEATFEEGVVVICSGAELDTTNYIRTHNQTGVRIEIRDIITDKQGLTFKQKPEAKVIVTANGRNLTVQLADFYSPLLMQKLEVENKRVLADEDRVAIADFKQMVDSVAIDIDYSGNLFNADITDTPSKKELVTAEYHHAYGKPGEYTVAVKIVDVLGEEYFQTFPVDIQP